MKNLQLLIRKNQFGCRRNLWLYLLALILIFNSCSTHGNRKDYIKKYYTNNIWKGLNGESFYIDSVNGASYWGKFETEKRIDNFMIGYKGDYGGYLYNVNDNGNCGFEITMTEKCDTIFLALYSKGEYCSKLNKYNYKLIKQKR